MHMHIHVIYTCYIHHLNRNIGGEASAFLKFLIDYYDKLPPHMVFLHSHRWAYHQEDIAVWGVWN
jgi:hypothetical protein